MNKNETRFLKRWQQRHPQIPLDFGSVGSLMLVGVDKTRSQIDFYNLDSRVVIEINGGTFMSIGGHNSGTGLNRDYVKQFICQINQWAYIELSSGMARDPFVLDCLAALIISRSKPEEIDFFYAYSQIVEANRWSNWRRFLPGAKKDATTTKANKRKNQIAN